MAHNSLTGTVIAPTYFGPGSGPGTNIISGTLRGDGTDIVYVPRVSNATNNSVLTNVGGDANTLTCETNLTFDGGTLSIAGDLTASIGVSASFFRGDGSLLTGIAAGTLSGSARVYTSTGLESSGYLKVSGSSVLKGGLVLNRALKTTDYTIASTDYYIGVNSTGGAIKLTLPGASTFANGQTWVIKDEGGNANSNNITISASAGNNTIDGTNQIVLQSPYATVQVYCDGNVKYFVC